jgi:succinate-semialdehyde dehydrogenase/glutarate-semialdehyde dehydrogenase
MHLQRPDLLRDDNYINGQWQAAASGRRFPVENPANGEKLKEVADGGTADMDAAITAADAAQAAWQSETPKTRAQILQRWYQLIIEHRSDLAAILTAEQGKVLAEADAEIGYGANYVEWFSEEAKRVDGDILAAPSRDKRLLVIKQAIGVVAAITPWNFPNAMITRKAAPALAAGCCIVIKPAHETPLSALALATLADEAGFPAGVFNVVCGTQASDIGSVMTSSPLVRKVSFTGSTRVGKILMEQCAATVKKTSMELGGNAPFIVFDDADLDAAVAGALASKYRNAGQTCICSNRILVQDGIYDAFAARFAAEVQKFRLGDGSDSDATMGPLITRQACEKVTALVDDALSKGASAITGGRRASNGERFFEPTVLRDATPDMRVFEEEIFGPVAPLYRFEDEQQAIALANDTNYGLAAYFYTQNLNRVWRVAEALEYGIIGINEGVTSSEIAPFGGMKESGIGREGSKYGIDDYVELKYLCLGGLDN